MTNEEAVDNALPIARSGEVFRAMMAIEVGLELNAEPGDKDAERELRNFRWRYKSEYWDGHTPPEVFLPGYAEALLERTSAKSCQPAAA